MKKYTNDEENKNYTKHEFTFDIKVKNYNIISINAKYTKLNSGKREDNLDDFF